MISYTSKCDIDVNKYDIVIVGAGLAGLRAAIELVNKGLKIAIITKVHPVRSHSNAAQGGINAPMKNRGDDWKGHAYDTIKGSDFLADQDAVEIMSSEAGEAVIDLEHMGVIFSRQEDGRLGTRRFGGQKQARTFFVGAITGSAILHVLYEQLLKNRDNIHIYEEWFVTNLITESDETKGLIAMDLKTGDVEAIGTKAIIIATGGSGRIFEPSTNALICTGDGLTLAYRSGVPLMDMEMIQFHPTTLAGSGILLSEAARGEGAYLLNCDGDRFMKEYAPDYMELASRDVVSRAEQTEINQGRGIDGNVLLDLRHLGREFIADRLGYLQEVAVEFLGIDLAEQPIPVRPGMHYIMGGIKTDENGVTNVAGLYAAGECANVSVHGANRLGANSLLDTVVFGRRSAVHAIDYIKKVAFASDSTYEQTKQKEIKRIANIHENEGDMMPAQIRNHMAQAMTDGIGVFRNQESMTASYQRVLELKNSFAKRIVVTDKGKVFNTNLLSALEVDFMLEQAVVICQSAVTREESRGAHYRTDKIERDDKNWLKHILITKDDKDTKIEFKPVTITKWKPVERVY